MRKNNILSEIQNKDFIKYGSPAVPYILSVFADVPTMEFNKIYGKSCDVFFSCKKDYVNWAYDQKQLIDFSNFILLDLDKRERGKFIKNLYAKWQKDVDTYVNEAIRVIDLLDKERVGILSENELKSLFRNNYLLFKKQFAETNILEPFSIFAQMKLPEILKNKGVCGNISEIIGQLTISAKKSLLAQYEDDLQRLAHKVYELKLLAKTQKIKENKKASTQVKNFVRKYFFIENGYSQSNELNTDKIFERIFELIKDKKRTQKKEKIKKKRNIKISFNKEEREIINLAKFFGEWQDERKKASLIYVSVSERLLKELARVKKIPFELLKYTTAREIHDNKIPVVNNLKDRKKFSLFYFHKNKTQIFTEKEAKNISYALFNVGKKEIIRGMTTYLDRKNKIIIGKVRTILTPREFGNFQKNEILVTGMTRPEFIPVVKNAKAIITDEGGLTCHAAIVSREMKIPCIIGTKNATRILREIGRAHV